MKKVLTGVVIVIVGAVVVAAAWYLLFAPKSSTTNNTQPTTTTTLPTSGSVTPYTTGASSGTSTPEAKMMSITLRDGTVVTTSNFIRNGVTLADKANSGNYLLAGNLGTCLTDQSKCQAGTAADFNAYYDVATQVFTINLTSEPIGQSRLDAEQFLEVTLGLSQAQMCGLNYYLGVTLPVNQQFAGKNLGFSFCPGATALPQ